MITPSYKVYIMIRDVFNTKLREYSGVTYQNYRDALKEEMEAAEYFYLTDIAIGETEYEQIRC